MGSELKSQSQVFLLDVGMTNLDRITQKRMGINDLKIELNLALANAGEIKEIVDQAGFQFDVAPDDLERLLHVFRRCLVVFEGERGRQHGRKRSAQFVTEHGEKLILGQV